jgi:MEMO1 family protein
MIVHACIVPHAPILVEEVAGERFEQVSKTAEAYSGVSQTLAEAKPETVVLVSPHGPNQRDSFIVCSAPRARADLSRFRAPQVRFEASIDLDLTKKFLSLDKTFAAKDWALDLDWGCSIPLHCLRSALGSVDLVLLGITSLDPVAHFQFGESLGQILQRSSKRVAFVCSADLSHSVTPDAPCGFSPQGQVFDQAYQKAVAEWDVTWVLAQETAFRRQATEDAIPQTSTLMGALNGLEVRSRVLSYEAPFGVGYMVAELAVAS